MSTSPAQAAIASAVPRCARRDAARGAEHLAALALERLDAGAADALGGAGDQDAFAFKIEVHSPRV